MAKELLRLDNLSKFYTGAQSVVVGLNSIQLSFSRGEFVAVTGESGSGKSTLSHVLGGILSYESGEMYFNGEPTSHFDSGDWERYRRDNISFISQNYGILPGATVMENVVSALLLTGMEKAQAMASAEELLKQVELWSMHRRRASKLSSGQKQRLSIARALAKPAPILIADEPTGNLDPENSAMVIDLLAQAAKERLVILVTHEFSEAEHLATRHITLQDGRVVMDAPLRPASEPQTVFTRRASTKPMAGYVARLQQRSRPVWSGFMALFFALTAFAVFAFLGTFIVHLDDSYTRVYDNTIFKNSDQNRIVVSTLDGEPMTPEDYKALVNVGYVAQLEPNGYVTDLQYAYREKVDFAYKSIEVTVNMGGYSGIEVVTYAELYPSAPYVQTIPVLPEGQTFLTAGRLPENFYEVVACGDEAMLGQELTVFLSNQDYWAVDQKLKLKFMVVGVTDKGSDLYFHEDVGRLYMQVVKTAREGYTFLPVMDLDETTFRAHDFVKISMISQYLRIRESMSRQNMLLPLEAWGGKIFANVNDPEGEGVWLNISAGQVVGKTLWHVASNRGMFYDTAKQVWRDNKSTSYIYGDHTSYAVQFYPVGDTKLAEDGSLTSGQYVIWNMEHSVALSGNRDYQTGIGYCYDPQPVVYEDGVLTGYTDTEIWDVVVEEGYGETMVRITREAQAMVPSGYNFNDRQRQIEDCWILADAKFLNSGTSSSLQRLVEVSYNNFDALTWDRASEQVSLTVTDYGYMDRVVEKIQSMGYAALSVYQLGSLEQDPELAQEREQTLLVCLLALIAVVALQVILLRAMFQTQMESYRLLSNIGLTAKTAKNSLLWQIGSFAILGQILSVIALVICWEQKVGRITHIIHYLPPEYMLLLIALHLLVSLGAAVWIMQALRKQVYPLTGRKSDLVIEEEQKEAVL